MHTEINIFDKPIERIRTMCQLMGLGADFDRKLPELETHLEGLVAEGENQRGTADRERPELCQAGPLGVL